MSLLKVESFQNNLQAAENLKEPIAVNSNSEEVNEKMLDLIPKLNNVLEFNTKEVKAK